MSSRVELLSQASQLDSSAWVQLLNSTRHFSSRILDSNLSTWLDAISLILSIERRNYSAWRSSDLLITLIYWESLSSSSLLDVKSFIYSHEKSRTQENNQNAFSFIDQSQTLNDCNCTFILTIHSMSTWHKSNQKKKRVTQYNHTLSLHHVYLSFITYFSAQWMTIIE